MVFLFSARHCAAEQQLTRILSAYGAGCSSDHRITDCGRFPVISLHRKTDLAVKQGAAVLLDDTDRFSGQSFPRGLTGICADTNRAALQLFRDSEIPVISCGTDGRNTVTLSSIGEGSLLASVQRSLYGFDGQVIEPAEYKIPLTADTAAFPVMAATAILLLHGIIPDKF